MSSDSNSNAGDTSQPMNPAAKWTAAAIHGFFGLLWLGGACYFIVGAAREARDKEWLGAIIFFLIGLLPARAARKAGQRAVRIWKGQEIVPISGGNPAHLLAAGIMIGLFLLFLYGMKTQDSR